MRGIDRQRRQNRSNLGVIVFLQPLPVGLAQAPQGQKSDAVSRQLRNQLALPAVILIRQQLADAATDRGEGLRRLQSVNRGTVGDGLDALLGSRDPDFKELIEIGADDAEEFDPLQERLVGIPSFIQHALVEFQPAQFAINKVFGGKISHGSKGEGS